MTEENNYPHVWLERQSSETHLDESRATLRTRHYSNMHGIPKYLMNIVKLWMLFNNSAKRFPFQSQPQSLTPKALSLSIISI